MMTFTVPSTAFQDYMAAHGIKDEEPINECNIDNDEKSNDINKIPQKTRFCKKILQLLNTTKKNPAIIPKVGLAWCLDGCHFICNSSILSKYLNIKSNSINTNFREHCFQIATGTTIENITREFGFLPDSRNWKKRRNPKYSFNINTSEEEAEKIPYNQTSDKKVESKYNEYSSSNESFSTEDNDEYDDIENTDVNGNEENGEYDDEVNDEDLNEEEMGIGGINKLQEIFNNDQFLSGDFEFIMTKVSKNEIWKRKFLEKVTNDFFKISKGEKCAKIDDVIQYILNVNQVSIIPNEKLNSVINNLHAIFQFATNESSQQIDEVTIVDAIKLCLRFGLFKDLASSVGEISTPNHIKSSGNAFVPWFIPSTDVGFVFHAIRSNSYNWAIKLSGSSPDGFTMIKLDEKNAPLDNYHMMNIQFDALANPSYHSKQVASKNKTLMRNVSSQDDEITKGWKFNVVNSELKANSWDELFNIFENFNGIQNPKPKKQPDIFFIPIYQCNQPTFPKNENKLLIENIDEESSPIDIYYKRNSNDGDIYFTSQDSGFSQGIGFSQQSLGFSSGFSQFENEENI
ncbi:hypothetical protein TRFO_32686 [Tritrichomonas foetus]|uniref:Initiator binding domain-containing protein n=1 Tax=Tritrichomonas foetus TaxID=1144522 RepID=A0A1J4JTM2_9EUKA|nr:hypothetical protein TRFO_32686 [Tritrichomonas foetus]|eukprot:OHT00621.1 hypothetical protein TRFO_32686 [Tritrichomonas foetus]